MKKDNFKFQILNFKLQKGQALITLLFFVIVSITITSAAVTLIMISSLSATKLEMSTNALTIAESGAENAMLRLLRNPFYTGETGLAVGNGTATITVSGTNPTTITSTGIIGNFKRRVEVKVGYTNNILTVQSWKEI